jgi:NAD(P)H dehydrogenase (quinone)
MKLVITGASGELGRKVTALLIAAGRATDLILVSRNPAALAEAAAAGATLRQDRPRAVSATLLITPIARKCPKNHIFLKIV